MTAKVTGKESDITSSPLFTRFIDTALRVLDNFEAKAEGYIPFTPLNIAAHHLDKRVKTILDLGCGKGDPMLFINRYKKYHTTGIDIFTPYLEVCRQKDTHNELIQRDVREISFPADSFDAILAFRVLEHISKEEGYQLLSKLEEIARYQVILITPIEEFKQSAYDENEFQAHKSHWSIGQFKEKGYKVYPNGLKGIQKDSATITRWQKFIAGIGHILWVFSGPLVMVFPSLAANVVAIKVIKS